MSITKHHIRIAIIALFSIIIPFSAMSVPANKTPFIMIQDGKPMTLTLHGDEYSHYYLTSDGFPLLEGNDGALYYAYSLGGKTKVSTFRAHDRANRSASEALFLSSIDTETAINGIYTEPAKSLLSQNRHKTSSPYVGNMLIHEYPATGSPKQLVLLVQFSDVKFSIENPHEAFNNLINQKGYNYDGATGSVSDYYHDNSNGTFNPIFTVIGPITLPNNEAYYGGTGSYGSVDKAPWEMVQHACDLIADQIDFSEYDNNHDGLVDNVFVFYAGYAQSNGAPSTTIWPHSANLTDFGINCEHNGVKVSNYACANELTGTEGINLTGIGTFCHEYGHVLGLPDIYETNNSGASFTPGYYELMDYGPYNNNGKTPPFMSVFDRMSVGWLNPTELTAPLDMVLNDISTNEGYIITTNLDNEFFLLENRQQSKWDTYIPGHGMLIWHIDYHPDIWTQNIANNNANHQYIDLVEADNARSSNTVAGDPFPGISNVTSFTDKSTPKMLTWQGFTLGKPITNIYEKNGIITFKFMGGGERPDKVTALEASDINATSFTANWTCNLGIQAYQVDLFTPSSNIPLTTVTTGDVASYTFTNLTPSTQYYYIVRAFDGSVASENSEAINVTTSEATFDLFTVTALPATGIGANQFTANWIPLEGTQSYILNVYRKEIGDPEYRTADFTGSIAGMPEGWSTTSSRTYSLSGYYGKEKPSLRMADTETLQTETFNESIRNFSFWCRGNGTAAENTILIEGYCDNKWEQIEVLSNITTEAGGMTYNIGEGYSKALEKSYTAIRLTYSATDEKYIAIDDVVVGFGGIRNRIFVDGYEDLNVGDATSHTVTNLLVDTDYYYTVKATDGSMFANTSDEIHAITSLTAVNTVAADGLSFTKANSDLIINNNSSKSTDIQIYDTFGRLVKDLNAGSGSTSVNLPENAVYVIRHNGRNTKIVF